MYQQFRNPPAMQHMDSFRSLDSTDSTNSYHCAHNRPVMQHMDSFRSIDSTDSAISYDTTGDKQFRNKVGKKGKFKKRNGKPKRPLSAYNIFFKSERAKLVQAKKKVGFANMAKEISVKWKNLSDEEHKKYADEAEIEQKKYRSAVKEWKAKTKFELSTQSTPLVPLLSHSHPVFLQNLMIQQQMMEQQKLMQEQMQNAIQYSVRRMSMPPMGCYPNPEAECTPEMETSQQFVNNQQQNRRLSAERRLSLPMQSSSQDDLYDDFPHVEKVTATLEYTNTAYDSTDESSLGDGLADMLINMPIFDDVEEPKSTKEQVVVNGSNNYEDDDASPEDVPSQVLSALLDNAESLADVEDMDDIFS
mmetsp:Transcript_2409/g.3695  ORF Transcript_2409/g.3695 Transcript_2409/m.3695 type:complete len:360 (+) Transcript_2409:83-1162(+)